MASTTHAEAIKGVEAIFERYLLIARSQNFTGFDRHLMSTVSIIDASPEGTVTFDLLIDERYSNINGVMHGGPRGSSLICVLRLRWDRLRGRGFGSMGLFSFLGGVTRSLNISYLRAIPIGTTVRITSTVMQIGRTMALIRGTMSSRDGSTVYCTCEHHKVAVPTRKEHLEYRVAWDGVWEGKGKDGKAKL
ncbi:hypothetical protein LSUB1_G003185 [Lachnellula subtilissima]|uniref:Thioesterase domain-containing protein n=1 Tax=Lachnellula subtilissima TaxID=602034 RepID=A0A8H8UAB8_9HELO|nr:hypothetical protein LSUB1_G003185 [Lachnellula subtilissima]